MPGFDSRHREAEERSSDQRKLSGVLAHPWSRVLLGLCVVELVVLIALTVTYRQLLNSNPKPVRRPAATFDRQAPLFQGKPGPWGELKYVRIMIEPPDEFVPLDERSFDKARWHFVGWQRDRLNRLFDSADLTPEQRVKLLNTNAWNVSSNEIVVTPGERLILELNTRARAKIYSALAEYAENGFQCWAFTWRLGGFDDWFQRSGVSTSVVALVKRLTYVRGQSLCFSDLPEVVAQIPTVAERRRLYKTLTRNSTLVMKLQTYPDSDVDGLVAYWAKGGRAKDLRPLLESLVNVPGGITMDIAQMLPPFARKRLNSYPIPPPDGQASAPDCFWTAFNFFNDPPDDRYNDTAVWLEEMRTNYVTVTTAVFGDLVFLVRPDETPVHSAVYIADDVVYTKNGGDYRQPWILMKWEDLVARYPQNSSLHTMILRSRKDLH